MKAIDADRDETSAPLPLMPDGLSLAIDRDDTVRTVLAKLYRVLDAEGLVDEYFSTTPIDHVDKDHAQACWRAECDGKPHPPRPPVRPGARWFDIGHRWVAVWPVTGGSEGVYVHVDLIGDRESSLHGGDDAPRHGLCFAKTWTWDNAWLIAHRLVELFEA
jgi:hypothetical protein